MSEINELAKALAFAQEKMKAAPKNGLVKGSFSFKYARFEDCVEVLKEVLPKNNLAYSQILDCVDGKQILKTKLMHSSGQFVESSMFLPNFKDMKEFGSAMTYAKRYSLAAIVGLAADEDLDSIEPKTIISVENAIESTNELSFSNQKTIKDYSDYVLKVGSAQIKNKKLKDCQKSDLQSFSTWAEKEKKCLDVVEIINNFLNQELEKSKQKLNENLSSGDRFSALTKTKQELIDEHKAKSLNSPLDDEIPF